MQHAWPISLNVAAAARWPFRQINKSNERPRFISAQSATSASDGPLPGIFNELYSKLTLAPLTVGSHKWPWQLSLNPFEFQMRQLGGHHGASIFRPPPNMVQPEASVYLLPFPQQSTTVTGQKTLQFQIHK